MYLVDLGVSLYMMRGSFFFFEKKTQERKHQENKRLLGTNCRPFHQRGDGLHPGARHLPVREVGRIFPCGVVSLTIVR